MGFSLPLGRIVWAYKAPVAPKTRTVRKKGDVMNIQAPSNTGIEPERVVLDDLSSSLLDSYQRNFPITSRPFADMAEQLNCSEPDVLTKLLALKDSGMLTRIGPVFDHKRAGASLLAAVSVPSELTEKVAAQINEYEEVNHNYGREHSYNLWFVVTAPTPKFLDLILDDMEKTIGFPILRLPMEKAYHIDLGFHVGDRKTDRPFTQHLHNTNNRESGEKIRLIESGDVLSDYLQQRLRELIQDGFPLTRKPFERLSQTLSQYQGEECSAVTELQVIDTLNYWVQSGLIKRIGLITNHHKLGYKENAMVVWNIPEDQTDRIGKIFKESGLVSLCYKRRRQLPEWPYNLYCMIHSRDRNLVAEHIEKLVGLAELKNTEKNILFSTHQYKQKGGVYTRSQRQHKIEIASPAANLASLVAPLSLAGNHS